MSQNGCVRRRTGDVLPYANGGSLVYAGDVVVVGNIPLIADIQIEINSTVGQLTREGEYNVPKDASTFSPGDQVYWNPTGSPVGGVASSGCCTSVAAGNYLMGFASPTATGLTGDAMLDVVLTAGKRTTSVGSTDGRSVGASTAAAGNSAGTATPLPAGTASTYPVTASDATKGVILSATDAVTGRTIILANTVTAQPIIVYPPTGGTINGAAANVAYTGGSGKSVLIGCLSGSGNTWFAIG